MMANNASTNLTRCHLFLQIFLLDNLDLGIFNKPHNVLPRISVFDGDSLRRMLTMAVDPIKGATSYSHANLRDVSTVCYTRQKSQISAPLSSASKKAARVCDSTTLGHDKNTNTPCKHVNSSRPEPNVATPGPLDFAKYLPETYPQLVADEVTMMLKQHNH
uniref:Uncharacterized protein n=1 Tax=Hordeum vulgare subsp. vulgare TaxID=112509 RepID=A0A8I6YG45_HORVV